MRLGVLEGRLIDNVSVLVHGQVPYVLNRGRGMESRAQGENDCTILCEQSPNLRL